MAKPVLCLAFFALVLASLGPVLDHHFAERQPGHEHLYLGKKVPTHPHPYQQVHAHPQTTESQPENAPTAPDDTIYLTNFSGIGQDYFTLSCPLLHASLVLQEGGDGPPRQNTEVRHGLSETTVSPLERPPLA
jgi:hypothetical protein